MKTDELVSLLAANAEQLPAHAAARRFAFVLVFGLSATALLMVIILGFRGDLMQAVAGWVFWMKLAFAASLATAGMVITWRLSHPGVKVGYAWLAVATPLILIWMGSAIALFNGVPDKRLGLLLGTSWKSCPWNIAVLSIPLFFTTFWWVRGLAPTRLVLSGAATGLMSGALSALIYSLHCTESALPFIGVWYVLGITIPATIGASLGPRLLRW